MTSFKTILMAAALLAAPAIALAQAPADQAAASATPAATAAPADSAVAAPALTLPDASIGQPAVKGWHLQPQVTGVGEDALWMHNVVLMPVVIGISVLVLLLLLWCVFRYRASANPVPSKTSHNTVIEVIWTLVPVLILLAIAVPSIKLLAKQYSSPHADLTVKVIGNQWYWSYEYPDNGDMTFDSHILPEKADLTPSELAKNTRYRTDVDGPRLLAVDERMVVPVGAVVKVIVTSTDVIHSFAIPALWTKMDAVPGRLNETWFKIDRPGVYYGQCSELCGIKHGFMPIAVEAVSPEKFAQWIASKGGTMPKPAGAPAAAAPAAADTPAPAAADAAAAAATPSPSGAATSSQPAPATTN